MLLWHLHDLEFILETTEWANACCADLTLIQPLQIHSGKDNQFPKVVPLQDRATGPLLRHTHNL